MSLGSFYNSDSSVNIGRDFNDIRFENLIESFFFYHCVTVIKRNMDNDLGQ